MAIDINKINNIDTDLVTPTINENLIETERDKWGNILNEQTFKTLNNNIRVLRESLIEVINNINVLNLEDVKLRLRNLETDRDTIENIVNRKVNGRLTIGIEDRELNLKGTELEFNGNKIDTNNIVYNNDLTVKLTDYAKLNKDNSFAGKITSNEIKSNSIETNELKVNGKNVITDTSNFAKLNTTNDFTQKIKGTDIESNKLIANELILNGINVNLSDYSTNNNVIKQIEKVAGLGYGGNIQDIGNKTKGKFYYDSVTKFYYECIEDNSLTYNDATKFRAISNKPISDKVENLFTFGDGWVKFPFGLIIQWGETLIPNGNNVITLPVSYKNSNSYQIVISDAGAGTHRIGAVPVNGNQFRAYGKNPNNEFASTGVRWQTIGY